MFKVVQVFRPLPGKMAGAMEISRQMHPLIMKHGCMSNRVFQVDFGGSRTGALIGEFEFESMGAYDDFRASMAGDPAFQALAQKAVEVFESAPERIGLTELNLVG